MPPAIRSVICIGCDSWDLSAVYRGVYGWILPFFLESV